MMEQISILIATGLYTGMLPLFPGVWGSLLGLGLWYFCRNLKSLSYIILTLFLFLVGYFASGHAEVIFAELDASPIVIDEILGIFVTLIFAPKFRFNGLVGYLLFISIDSIKPFPISWIDNNMHGGLGIMLDDLVAGILALLILRGFYSIWRKKDT